VPPSSPAHDPERELRLYVRDHYAGSAAGLTLAKQVQRSHAGTERQALVDSLVTQIREDRDQLQVIMARLGVRPSIVKQVLATISVAALLGGVKIRAVRGLTPLGRHMEVETLVAGVVAKRSLWESLRAARHPLLDRAELDALIARADAQYEAVLELRDDIARESFGDAAGCGRSSAG